MKSPDGVRLSIIDEDLLQRLTEVAISESAADEVTPPLTGDDEWSPARIAWFQEYHRFRRDGLDGPAGEATWAVVVSSSPVGAVRLQTTNQAGVLEVGIWLARSIRGMGAAQAALQQVLREARLYGARSVIAETSVSNARAQALLARLGFTIGETTPGGRVRAMLGLGR